MNGEGVNWAERLLVLVGLLLVAAVAAAGVFTSFLPANYSYDSAGQLPLGVIVTQLIAQFAGPLATVGLSSLAGVAFLRAAHWRPPSARKD
jgi:uncharacterized protein involved in exopolysaccharide biosynthesis